LVIEKYVAIHYRIGDKRAKYTHSWVVGEDGILDPICFLEVLINMRLMKNTKIYVLSDEPLAAQELLAGVGIHAITETKKNNLWQDLYCLSQARVLIGSWSQVSQLAAVCVSYNGGLSFLPRTVQLNKKMAWKIPKTNFFQPKYLPESHPIYSGTH
jgi:hypothetical protein